MGTRILGDYKQAVMYCSTDGWAFGPVFSDDEDHDADERANAFMRWLKTDARVFTDTELSKKYSEWLAQEDSQWQAERLALKLKEDEDV